MRAGFGVILNLAVFDFTDALPAHKNGQTAIGDVSRFVLESCIGLVVMHMNINQFLVDVEYLLVSSMHITAIVSLFW